MPGALAISKSFFMDKYLVETAFNNFDMSMVDTMNEMLQWIQDSWRREKGWLLTDKPRDQAVPETNWQLDPSGAKLTWSGLHSQSVSGYYGHDAKSTLLTSLTCVPRINQIKLEVYIYMDWYSYNQPIGSHGPEGEPAIMTNHNNGADIKLNLTLFLISIVKGLLSVTTKEELEFARCRNDHDKSTLKFLEWLCGPSNTELADKMTAQLQDVAKMKHIGDVLAERINKQRQYVFPGGGTFEFNDPVFSDRGGLLTRLKYKQMDLQKVLNSISTAATQAIETNGINTH